MNFPVKKIEFEFGENISTSNKVKVYTLFEMALKKHASKTAFNLVEEGIEFNKKIDYTTVLKVLANVKAAGFVFKELEYESDETVEVEIE